MTDRISQLRNLLESQPDDTFCLYGIAMEHAKAGRYTEAIAHFDLTTEIDPDYCYAYYHKARCLVDAGRPDEARTTLETGLNQARSSGDIHAEGEIQALLAEIS
ncbi:MAG: tetratricopeptide repeat protein [Phycisphaerales bacterium]|nr:tetratricopeptide repeat protein [Phycisphaerales bacterium]